MWNKKLTLDSSYGSTVTPSTSNGSININGIDRKVYDDSNLVNIINSKANSTDLLNKTNLNHEHELADINDVDSANKTNGYVLTWDSTLNKFVSKALPSGTGSGATNLDGLSDVDVSTTIPVEGNILKYESGIWKPSVSANNIGMQDFVSDGIVENLIPYDIRNLYVSNLTKTTIDLKWEESKSTDVKDYNIYIEGTLIGNVAITSYQIINLTAETDYTVVVKARNINNIESNGVFVNAKTYGNFALSTTANQYIEVPTITFSKVEMLMSIIPTANSWDNTIIQAKTLPTDFKLSTQFDGIRFFLTNAILYVNGVKTGHSDPIPVGQIKLYEIQPTLRTVTDSLNIMASKTGSTSMTSILQRIKFYTLGDKDEFNLVSDYDLTNNIIGTNIADNMQNSPDLILHGGTFIAN